MRGQRPDHALDPTALVNEAYLRLVGGVTIRCRDRTHFFAVAARAMRQILVDHARAHRTKKRGGETPRVSLSRVEARAGPAEIDLIALDEALSELAEKEPRTARVVELRFFGGLNRREVAEILEVTVRTVANEWRFAQAWLGRALEGGDV